jgi:hypothetical protein
MSHPNKHIGRCFGGMHNICTEKGNYAYGMMRLGKQVPLTLTDEQMALQKDVVSGYHNRVWYNVSNITEMPNPVFLYEITQLGDSDMDRLNGFIIDMQHYLELPTPLAPMLKHRPDRVLDNATQVERDAIKIDICKDEYQPVRDHLMLLSRRNSQWLREVFMESPGVYYSNKGYLLEILEGWMRDPCETRAASA